MTAERTHPLPEKASYLALIALAPAIWMAHFLLSYATVSLACAPVMGAQTWFGSARTWIGGFTVVALAAIALCAWSAYQRHTHGEDTPPHDADTPEDRHRFLGYAGLLLAGLSAVATVYSAIAVFTFRAC